ncbi:MAG TPA: ABC transporter substrate-binding protein [Caldilineaceae bacterium]|nr:ABC transporter substrate-binding protein [Caldilineaceae bacterium]
MDWRRCMFGWFSLLIVVSLVFAACAAPAPAPATGQEPAAEEAATEAAPAAEQPVATSDRAKTLIMDIDGGRVQDPELWNPFVPGNRRDHGYHQVCLEPLFILNYQTGEILPWLGESFTPNDTLDVWTLKLRDGVKWQDGEAFNADDVVYTINEILLPHAELSNGADMQRWVQEVTKIDDLTVEFTLVEPNPRFQLDYFSVKIWGGVNIMPEHIWRDQDPLTFKFYDPEQGWPVCTGPYKLQSVSPTEFTWVRDDNWWGAQTGFQPLPQPETIIWTWAGPEETRAALMADGQLDSLMDITYGALQALQAQNPNVITWFDEPPYAWVPDPCSRTFEFNTTRAPWDDPEMRWAINYAIDRDEIVEIAYEGTTLASKHFFPAYPPLDRFVQLAEDAGLYEKYPLMTHDPDQAKAIIESKGYTLNSDNYYEKDGQVLSIDITTHEAFIEKQRIAQVIVEQLQRIGINASTRNEAGSTWGDNFAMGNFEARMGWQTCGSVNEPWSSMNTFNVSWLVPVGERASYNAWRWSGENAEQYSQLVDQMGSLPLGDPQIDELFVQAMDLWMAELPVIPITQAKKIIPFDTTYWRGWPTAENDYLHPPTWWQHFHAILPHLEATGAQ